jgi:serine/threonine protein kinase
VEEYLRRWPTLGTQTENVLRLILNEFDLRKELGEKPSPEEYFRRFPACAEALGRRLASPADSGGVTEPLEATGAYTPPPDPPPPPPPAPQPRKSSGELPTIPGYEVVAYIDGGGQGSVYRARHLALDRVVALKILRDPAGMDEEQLARFRREGKLSARLDHPNIIRVYDHAEWEGRTYFTMEFAPGGSLKGRLAREGPLPPRGGAELLVALTGAVQHAHERGILHRDLKPGNVLFAGDGTPKIADFGLAKRLSEDDTELTKTRMILGSAGYMAPEQAAGEGRHATFATDIYGLGAVLYATLTGQPPFGGGDWLDVLIHVRTRPVTPPSRLRPDVPAALEKICLKCLEKDPARRYQTAGELKEVLQRFLAGELPPNRPGEGPGADSQILSDPETGEATAVTLPSTLGSSDSSSDEIIQAGSSILGSSESSIDENIQAGARFPIIPGYEILGEIGRGGMGVVYKAKQLSLNRIVALKTILGPVPREWQRLRVEAETVASLHHPHIVQIHDLGEFEGQVYIAMEYVEGGTLHRLLRGEPQPPYASAELLEQLAEAIGFAHRRGLVHRDLKPANVLLLRPAEAGRAAGRRARPTAKEHFGFPKITDFGLVRRLGRQEDMEKEGMIVGTPSYMSPEQAGGRSQDIGPGPDVWCLGAILYEMLTGRPPFRGPTVLDTLMEVIQGRVLPPSRLRKIPADLEAICLKCLRKDPAQRYADGVKLAEDLHRFLQGRAPSARGPGFWDRMRFWLRG